MARLIDVEPILMRWNTELLGRKDMYDMVKNAPAIDIVRCKDCKYYTIPTKPYKSTTPYCLRKAKTKMQSDGFCSCGERKDND